MYIKFFNEKLNKNCASVKESENSLRASILGVLLAQESGILYYKCMYILIIAILAGLFTAPDDEKTSLRQIQVSDLKHRLEIFVSEENLKDEAREQVMDILHFKDFIGYDLSGNRVNYSNPNLDGYTHADIVIFGYYAEWCPNCRQNLPAALRLYETYSDRGLEIILTFMYSDEDRVREYVYENQIPFPVLIGSEDREVNPEVRLETTHYILRSLLDDYRRWGTPFYILYINDKPDTWYVVAGEFIEEEIDAFLAENLSTH